MASGTAAGDLISAALGSIEEERVLLGMTVLMNTNIRCGETLVRRQPENCLHWYGVQTADARGRKSKDNKFGVFFGQSLGGVGGGSRCVPGVVEHLV